jgi:hypothetical protein
MGIEGVHLFPVRHHSPRSATCLRALLDTVHPELVLVEGPSDADSLIPVITDPESSPPIAILAYRTDGTPQSVMWPFATYSPEYQALLWAREHGAAARFIDWPSGVALGAGEHGHELPEEPGEAAEEKDGDRLDEVPTAEKHPGNDRFHKLAERFGLRHFNEFWDAYFETPSYDPVLFREALTAYADFVAPAEERDAESAMRDKVMAEAIAAAIKDGVKPGKIVVVLGAAHVAALVRGDLPIADKPPRTVPSALAVVPYSYLRLSEQSGYGAGNRAPWYYERAYKDGIDFARASLMVLIEFAGSLRLRGFSVSLADVIEGYRLSITLATVRGKSAPGVDELAEAACATLTRGEQAPIREFLLPLIIGRRVGRLGASAGRNSLQKEFAEGLETYGLPHRDELEVVTLRLSDSKQAEASLFLHRLRVADVPYASYAGSRTTVSHGKKSSDDEPGGYGAFSRVREHWEAQWTPATEVALAERVVYGERFAEVCERRLNEQIDSAAHASDATRLLVDSVLTEALKATARALDTAERLSSTDDDVQSLAGAARTLAALRSYGASRSQLAQLGSVIERLLVGTFTRGRLRLPMALTGDQEASAPAREAMAVLNELALAQPILDREAWFGGLREIAWNEALEPSGTGTAAALLYLARELADTDLAELLERRLNDVIRPARAADFLSGFFSVNALVLLKNREVVAALSRFLGSVAAAQFRDALPALRRAFSVLGASERRFLLEHLVALHGKGAEKETAQALTTTDAKALEDLGKSLGAALDDLNDLL